MPRKNAKKHSLMNPLERVEAVRKQTETALQTLIVSIGPIQIASPKQLPQGWRKAAKGRTVWRILEEIITQNLEAKKDDLGINKITPSDSEVSIFDARIEFTDGAVAFINIKSAVEGGDGASKDDISKAVGLENFYEKNPESDLFVATFVLRFTADIKVHLIQAIVLPVAWLPDIYVNPSNNGNLQSSKYKDLASVARRTNPEFLHELRNAMKVAAAKKAKKAAKLGKLKNVSGEAADLILGTD